MHGWLQGLSLEAVVALYAGYSHFVAAVVLLAAALLDYQMLGELFEGAEWFRRCPSRIRPMLRSSSPAASIRESRGGFSPSPGTVWVSSALPAWSPVWADEIWRRSRAD